MNDFKQAGCAHAAANTHRDNAILRAAPPALDQDVAGKSRPCPSRKSYSLVAIMQSGQDWYGDDGPRALEACKQVDDRKHRIG